jgi:hypothetical protein
MTLKRSRGGHKSAHTIKKKKLESLKRHRFPRLSAQEIAKDLRHCIETNQMIWTLDLFRMVIEDAKKQGLHPLKVHSPWPG